MISKKLLRALLAAGAPNEVPKAGAAAVDVAGVAKVLPNAGAVVAAGVPNVEPKPVNPVDVAVAVVGVPPKANPPPPKPAKITNKNI